MVLQPAQCARQRVALVLVQPRSAKPVARRAGLVRNLATILSARYFKGGKPVAATGPDAGRGQHLGQAFFQVRWQALTGLSPQAWLRDQRLDAAQRQLKAGWPLETVALQVGYRSASALLFALRRDRGQTTRHLRGG